MNRMLALVLGCACGLLIYTTAQNNPAAPKPSRPAASADEQAILEVETSRVKAMLAADAKALDKIWSPDYVQVTSKGELRNKNHMLNAFRSGDLRYTEMKNRDLMVITHGNTAIVTGRSLRVGKERERDMGGYFRFMRTWIKEGNNWVLLAQQSTVTEKF